MLPWSCCRITVIGKSKTVGTREWAIAVTSLNMLFCRTMWTTLGLWIRKVDEHCKWGLMRYSSRCLEDSRTESHVDYEGPAEEVSEVYNNSWARDHFYNIFTMNVTFCSSKNLPEA